MYEQLFGYIDDIALLIIVLIPTAAAIASAGLVMVEAFRNGRNVWREGRNFVNEVRGLFDEDTDPLILAIAHKTGKTPAQVRKVLNGMLDQVIAIMPVTEPRDATHTVVDMTVDGGILRDAIAAQPLGERDHA